MSSPNHKTRVLSPRFLYDFQPGAERARFLDRRMRSSLKDSLGHVFKEIQKPLKLSKIRSVKFLSQLKSKPVSPLAFSFFCDLVIAIENNDLVAAKKLAGKIIALPVHPGGPKISNLRDPKTDFDARQYARYVDTDPRMPFQIFAPAPKAATACRRQINFAFKLMDAGDPVLAGEIRALIREIVLAAGSTKKTGYTFDGVSSFMLWGAIVINAGRAREPLTMVRMLAHESAHNLLFGMTMDEPLLKNSPEERYKSPLRDDPRPLEGIYHATFVSARMYRAVKTLLEGGTLPVEWKQSARKSLATDANCFVEGMKVIRQHARLTKIGKAIIQSAAGYMDAAS